MGGSIRGYVTCLVLCWGVGASSSAAQIAGFDRNTVFIDPAHGGADSGARIGDQVAEKDVTLALAMKLRTALTARSFTVTMTRSGDTDGILDDRAEMANRSHAVACLVLHASATTAGVVLGTSALGTSLMRKVSGDGDKLGNAVLWSRAQETYVTQSGRLANQLGTALTRSGIPVTLMRVVMRPLDNLTCAAISAELGTHSPPDGPATSSADDAYQQRVADSIADVLAQWRSEALPPTDALMTTAPARGATP